MIQPTVGFQEHPATRRSDSEFASCIESDTTGELPNEI
jgi:hypothetical protein